MNKKLLLWQPVALIVGLSGAFSCAVADDVTTPPAKSPAPANVKALAPETIAQTIDIAPVWAGHPVDFDLLTHGEKQFVGFYDADRNLTIGQRKLSETAFQLTKLPSKVGWDSHNKIAIAIDELGFVHVAANMHKDPLTYFRSTRPLDASSLQKVPQMTGEFEGKVTYPNFFSSAKGEFLFSYRDGQSSNGKLIYNIYDPKTKVWKRLLDEPLLDGQDKRNAYPSGPKLGPDGYYHLSWVWRDSSDASSNHDLSYARSRDLLHWENSKGEALKLPITLETGEIVDAVPVKGGIINGGFTIGFDGEKRPILSYYKYDAKGKTQIYNARLENGAWKVHQTTDWDYRWDFSGGGSLAYDVNVQPIQIESNGTLTQIYGNKTIGKKMQWILDPQTLKPIAQLPPAPKLPKALREAASKWPGMGVNLTLDGGESGEKGVRYALKWETLGANRDLPREPPFPPPSMLRLYKLQAGH